MHKVNNQSTTFHRPPILLTQMVDAKLHALLRTISCLGVENSSLVERCVVELDIVAPDAPEAGQDLGEGSDDEVLAVPARREIWGQ